MTKPELQAWQEGWKRVNDVQLAQLQAMSIPAKLQQWQTLRQWAVQMEWAEKLREGDEEVRERWSRLRRAYYGR